MKLSTKGQYAVIAMVDIALNGTGAPVRLSEIAERQKLSISYLEQLFNKLRRHGLVNSVRGATGGYILAGAAEDIKLSQIMDAVDELVKTTRCGSGTKKSCLGLSEKCLTHHMWCGLADHIRDYLSAVSLKDVCEQRDHREAA
ncbi:MAG: Rrf2 family transcriptional regulator [Alphaproteobacteria bacterium]